MVDDHHQCNIVSTKKKVFVIIIIIIIIKQKQFQIFLASAFFFLAISDGKRRRHESLKSRIFVCRICCRGKFSLYFLYTMPALSRFSSLGHFHASSSAPPSNVNLQNRQGTKRTLFAYFLDFPSFIYVP